MSDNDDILNYELGDVDAEEELIGEDEDDLLLSDEESPPVSAKITKQQEAQLLDETEEWVSLELAKASVKIPANSQSKKVEHKSSDDDNLNNPEVTVLGGISGKSEVECEEEEEEVDSSSCITFARDSDVTTTDTEREAPSTEESPMSVRSKPRLNRAGVKSEPSSQESYKSTTEVSSSIDEIQRNEQSGAEDQVTESTTSLDTSMENVHDHDELDYETNTTTEVSVSGTDYEDDEREERLNPKHAVERDGTISDDGENQMRHLHPGRPGLGQHQQNIHRSPGPGHRGGRHFGPRGGPGFQQRHLYPPPHNQHGPGGNPNDMFHPQHQQFQGGPYTNQPNEYRGPLPGGQHLPQQHPPQMGMGHPYPPRGPPRGGDMMQNGPPFRGPFNPGMGRPGTNPGGPRMMMPRYEQMRPGMRPQGHPGNQFVGHPRPPMQQGGGQPGGYPPPGGQQPLIQNLMQPQLPPQHHQSGGPPPLMPGGGGGSGLQSQVPSVIPRKILINPNFKHGGWEAAKSQLILDNIISPHYLGATPSLGSSSAQNDDELLRQQEEFINKNRAHIEKRRYERSPSRDRDYTPSPPPRRRAYSRERDHGRSVHNTRGRGNRRGSGSAGGPQGGRGGDTRRNNNQKRMRRSESLERESKDEKPVAEEDEETKKYRLEIEKQKAMREKILREKEERRKRAAEEKLKGPTPEKKANVEEPEKTQQLPQKLKPIVVDGSRIISLKKKSEIDRTSTTTTNPTTKMTSSASVSGGHTIQRSIPTAKVIPETKRTMAGKEKSSSTMAVVRPQLKRQPSTSNEKELEDYDDDDDDDDDDVTLDDEDIDDDRDIVDDEDDNENDLVDELDEDALLADSPSTSPTPPTPPPESFKSRRVVLKSSSELNAAGKHFLVSAKMGETTQPAKTKKLTKGIFDRLDAKKIGVSDSSKKSIQRIVIHNTNNTD